MAVGFLLPAVASFTLRVHQGYNLYNVGFTAGLIGMVLASFFKSFGHTFEARLAWSTGNNLPLAAFLFGLFALMALAGFWWNGRSFRTSRASPAIRAASWPTSSSSTDCP